MHTQNCYHEFEVKHFTLTKRKQNANEKRFPVSKIHKIFHSHTRHYRPGSFLFLFYFILLK